jgi:beta-N-acetylglucosaminidase
MQGYDSHANKYPELFLSSDSIDEVVKAIVDNKNARQIGNRFKTNAVRGNMLSRMNFTAIS